MARVLCAKESNSPKPFGSPGDLIPSIKMNKIHRPLDHKPFLCNSISQAIGSSSQTVKKTFKGKRGSKQGRWEEATKTGGRTTHPPNATERPLAGVKLLQEPGAARGAAGVTTPTRGVRMEDLRSQGQLEA